ncbi:MULTISPECIES: glycosyltransferase [unclassified Saccharothrix]|uniref:glycosyltransferase n=1 Tax=unclassified Saccharothrix TaxID=2593673 RepID=UPI00307F77AB
MADEREDVDEPLAGLDGRERQQVAAALWRAWRVDRRSGVLTGLSGIGKSQGVVGPLRKRADVLGIQTLSIEVPPRRVDEGTRVDLEAELLERLRTEMEHVGIDVAEDVQRRRGLFITLSTLLRRGALVVIDEFQRLLGADGRPEQPFADELAKLVDRPGRGGLWLVSNRTVDPVWTEPFHVATLPRPGVADAVRIVLDGMPSGVDPEQLFPVELRERTVERLGANPRVLRLLGSLLGVHELAQLLGPDLDPDAGPAEPDLVEAIERALVAKATEGLPDDGARRALEDLSVLDDGADADLREAMIGRYGDAQELTRELLGRYLLEGRASSCKVHPVVRELDLFRRHGRETEWRDAHRRAGEWYARPLRAKDLSRTSESRLGTALERAQRHLRKAAADDVLAEVHEQLARYLGQYSDERAQRLLEAERDGRITLLTAYLSEVDDPGLSYHLASLLRGRGRPGDLPRALAQAERATRGKTTSYPWILWVQLVRQVEGLQAAVQAGREAARHVRHYLYRVYTAVGAALAADGRPAEAVAELRKGCRAVPRHDRYRLAQHALFYAAGESDPALLEEVCEWLRGLDGLGPQAILGDILLLQHRGRWRESAERAHGAVAADSKPLVHFHVAEAVGWLAEGEPDKARAALRGARDTSNRRMPREGKTWLAALVELSDGNAVQASRKLGEYLDTDDVPTKPREIKSRLLHLWDHHIATEGEFNPSFHIPVLPPAITGQPGNVHRPQYGGPVLPQHRTEEPVTTEPAADGRPTVLAVATEWSSAHGGLSTFNRRLCVALATAGARVFCTAPHATEQEIAAAAELGVTLVKPARGRGGSALEVIGRRPELPPGVVPDLVIGHGRITGRAADGLLDDFPEARRLHFIHMAPDEIEWFKTGRDDDTGVLAETRHQEELDLGRDAHRVVAVGPRLHGRYVRDFSPAGTKVLRMDPGFDDAEHAVREPPPGTPWSVLVFGRAEDAELKGLDIAARAVAGAIRRRAQNAARLELKVRGAPANTSEQLRDRLVAWSDPSLRPVVRTYSTDAAKLADDLHTASLVLMPSRAEGFGLVGLEAIVAGTPVLVSGESGLGELLVELLPEDAERFVVPVTGAVDVDAEAWERAVSAVLRNRRAAFEDAAWLRRRLAEKLTWAGAAKQLLADCE